VEEEEEEGLDGVSAGCAGTDPGLKAPDVADVTALEGVMRPGRFAGEPASPSRGRLRFPGVVIPALADAAVDRGVVAAPEDVEKPEPEARRAGPDDVEKPPGVAAASIPYTASKLDEEAAPRLFRARWAVPPIDFLGLRDCAAGQRAGRRGRIAGSLNCRRIVSLSARPWAPASHVGRPDGV